MAASDFRINSSVRSLLARRWVDLKKAQVSSFRGTVRVSGEISKLGCEGVAPPDPHFMDHLELEIQALPEVERVYFEISNWRRNESGHWLCLDGPASGAIKRVSISRSDEGIELIFETTGKNKAAPPARAAVASAASTGKPAEASQGANP
jgi:hypothetical protein